MADAGQQKPRIRRVHVLLLVLLASVISSVVYHSRYGRRLNVLLISVDALRHDHLGFMGYPRRVSPNLDRLARESVVFRQAYSQSGWTLPSMATILTGLYPHEHGATRLDTRILPEVATLASILEARGYDTRGYVSHSLASEIYGLDRGFRRFDSSVIGLGHPAEVSTSEQLTDLITREIEQVREPYFIWAHYFDPHARNLVHSEFDFGSSPLDAYDSEIAHNDREIGRLLDDMEEKGLLGDTIIVFTSDHGEELMDHGALHHFTLFEEVLRVPLTIQVPGGAARSVEGPVQQIDLLPTLLTALGIGVTGALPGRDVLGEPPPPRAVFAERYQPNLYRQRAVIMDDYKLISIDRNPDPAEYAESFSYDKLAKLDEGLFLYHIGRDSRETTNILGQEESTRTRLVSLLEEHFGSGELPEDSIEVSKELEERLRRLGYIGE
ncbi:MAG: sulfatase [Deltaproteobacteria bacterium]|nr:sulfatase [Deltaproteobacteria bacterium]